jgi:hypothetical protein
VALELQWRGGWHDRELRRTSRDGGGFIECTAACG